MTVVAYILFGIGVLSTLPPIAVTYTDGVNVKTNFLVVPFMLFAAAATAKLLSM